MIMQQQPGPMSGPTPGQEPGQAPETPELHPILEQILEHKTKILGGIVALLVLVGSYSGYQSWSDANEVKAREELAQLVGLEDLEGLTEMAENGPSSVRTGALLEIARLAELQGDLAGSAKSWGELAEISDSLAPVAKLGQARALLEAGDAMQAFTVADDVVQNAPKAYLASGLRITAVAATRSGDAAKAIDAYTRLLEFVNEQEKGYIEYQLAKLKAG
jgi:hypothetical protein